MQAFQDGGQYWDAWNIDPNYSEHPLSPPKLIDIYWVEGGNLRWRLRVIREIGKSTFRQDYVLEKGSRVLKVENWVDWQESHVLVKAGFAFNGIESDRATYEIPCGAIERTTRPQTPQENAKWEVPAFRWADISNDDYGVSLLNDCKYGYDAKPDELRLTLLRGSTWPDPEADKGIHEFSYAIYPHFGSWQDAGTVRRGYELNMPPVARQVSREKLETEDRKLPPNCSFFKWEADNLILMAFKQSEDNSQQWVLRCYECQGQEVDFELASDLDLALIREVNLLENPANKLELLPKQSVKVSPWKIVSWLLSN